MSEFRKGSKEAGIAANQTVIIFDGLTLRGGGKKIQKVNKLFMLVD